MRKLIACILAAALLPGSAAAQEEQDNFLVSDWMLLYTLGDSAIAEQTVFVYEDNTFEIMDDESKKGSWTFDGETLILTADDETVSLLWEEAEHRFTGEYNGMTLTLYMSVQPENEDPSGYGAEAPDKGAACRRLDGSSRIML